MLPMASSMPLAHDIPFLLVKGDPIRDTFQIVKKIKAACLVTDFASLRLCRQ